MKKVNNESFKFGQVRAMIEVPHLIFIYAPKNAMHVTNIQNFACLTKNKKQKLRNKSTKRH